MIPLNMWNLEYDKDELIYRSRLTDMKKRFGVVNGKGGKLVWEFGVSRCKLQYIEWNNTVLVCSTGNYIQYP